MITTNMAKKNDGDDRTRTMSAAVSISHRRFEAVDTAARTAYGVAFDPAVLGLAEAVTLLAAGTDEKPFGLADRLEGQGYTIIWKALSVRVSPPMWRLFLGRGAAVELNWGIEL